MTDPSLKFAEGFPMPTYEQWVAEVEKALKGAPFDKHVHKNLRRRDAASDLHPAGLAAGGRSIGFSGVNALHPGRPRRR